MEDSEAEEPEKKKPHIYSLSPTMARNSSHSPSGNKSVDATVLQYQNQKLVQQLEFQKQQLHDVENKIRDLQEKQSTYDDLLIKVNLLWNQLVDDLVLLGVHAGAGKNALQTLEQAEQRRGSIPSCRPEEIFLYRLLEADHIETHRCYEVLKYVEEALASRCSSTMDLMKCLEDTIAAQKENSESIAGILPEKLSAEDAIMKSSKIDDMMKEEAKALREVINVLRLKHQEFTDGIQKYISNFSADQSEIKRLAGELEESMAELEDSRRKFVNLKLQKDAAAGAHTTAPGLVNGNLSPEKPAEKARLRELRDSIEENKVLAADRLSELEAAKEYNLSLSKQLQDVEDELKDENYVHSSRLYNLVNDQLQHWIVEKERYKVLTDSLQAERSFVVRREKELTAKAEFVEAARKTTNCGDSRIEELEQQLQRCIIENNELEVKMEETVQDSGRKDIKTEFRVMASALSKEMEMMETQLNRWKDTAHEASNLREESQNLKAVLSNKADEQKVLAEKCAMQESELKSLKHLNEKLQEEKLELQIFLDMYSQEGNDKRDLKEIKESEAKAHLQAEQLKGALDEHSLELRVRAANETEAACQRRLSAAETEIAELRAELDTCEREVWELTEAIKIKEREGEAYISEMETIGQAYEDMQTQNQHLLQQLTERDDYNIKLVSESVKTKHAQSSLMSEKQALAKQLQQASAIVDSLKARIAHSEEQMKACLSEALKSVQEGRHLAISLETAKWELADSEKELKWLKSALASSEKDYEQIQRRMSEVQTELDEERSERKKLEEELMDLNNQFAELSSESVEAATQRLQEEIKNCRNILKCGVCFDRPKEVVIVKCYHLFCNQCIQRNLEIRHRKCPGCGTAFGQNDVRFVKM